MLWQIIKKLYAHIEAVCSLLIIPVPCPSPAGLFRLHTHPTKQMDACLLIKQLLIDVALFCLLIILNLLTVTTNACFLYQHFSGMSLQLYLCNYTGPTLAYLFVQLIYEGRLKASVTIRDGLRQRTSRRSLHKTPQQRKQLLLMISHKAIYIQYLQMGFCYTGPGLACTILKEQ